MPGPDFEQGLRDEVVHQLYFKGKIDASDMPAGAACEDWVSFGEQEGRSISTAWHTAFYSPSMQES